MMIMVLVTLMMVMVLVANMWLGRMVKEKEEEDGVDGNHVAGEDPVQGFRLRVRVDWPLSRATE